MNELRQKLVEAEAAVGDWKGKAEVWEQSRAEELSKAMLRQQGTAEQIADLEARLAAAEEARSQAAEAKEAAEASVAEYSKRVAGMEEELSILVQSTDEGQQKQREMTQHAMAFTDRTHGDHGRRR